MFGLPWWAIIALVNLAALIAGILLALDEIADAFADCPRATRFSAIAMLVVVGACLGLPLVCSIALGDALRRARGGLMPRGPQIQRQRRNRAAAVPSDSTPPEQSTACPRCGAELVFRSDAMGYGQTIEQCARFPQCDHWRTLERLRIPAHRPAPRGDERPRKPRDLTRVLEKNRARGVAARRRVLDQLPSRIDLARTVEEIAPGVGLGRDSVKGHLDALVRTGHASRRPRRVPGVGHRPPFEYWRAA